MRWLDRLFALPKATDLYRGQTVKLYPDGREVRVADPSPRWRHSDVFTADDGYVYNREEIMR